MATEYAFVDDSGTTRLEGFLVPEPGGSSSFVATGPYPIAFDTPGLVNPVGSGIVLDTFPVGTLFLQAMVIVSVPFGGGGATDVYAALEIGPAGDWDNQASTAWNHIDLLVVATLPVAALFLTGRSVAPFTFGGGGIGVTGYNSFGLYVSADGAGLDAGAADIYVVTATPTAP